MSTQLVSMDTRYGFTPEQINVIKATIAPGASDDELALFLMVCQKTGLDPFSRQIYLSERWTNGVSKKTPETTIDGFRVIAERSGKYAGQAGPFWCGHDGIWRDVWLAADMPAAAKVGVLRSDFREPVWGVALFLEYAQYKRARDGKPPELNSMWQKMGANQLAKCAESLGLRKAFPRDLSGMYTREEMAQATKDVENDAKEAQLDVAERHIKELSGPRLQPSPKMVPEVPFSQCTNPSCPIGCPDSHALPPSDYESRHTALILEANAVLDEVSPLGGVPVASSASRGVTEGGSNAEKSAPRNKGDISFKALKEIGTLKKVIRDITGSDEKYYEALKAAGAEHADELSLKVGREVYKALLAIPNAIKQDKALLLEVRTHALRIGPYATEAALERRGLKSVEEVLKMPSGDELDALLRELRETA